VADTVAKPEPKFTVAQLSNWKLLEEFQRRLQPVLDQAPPTPTEQDPRRKLLSADYFSMMLFALLNPVLKTTRAISAASQFERRQAEVCGRPVSLGSFSAMQHLVEPELLAGLLRSLAAEAQPVFGDERVRTQVKELIANDGTLLPALPRRAWALWQDAQNRAGKLHLEFSVWREVPVEFTVTHGNASERAVWKEKLRAGACYVNDRNYSHDYRLIKGNCSGRKKLMVSAQGTRRKQNFVLDSDCGGRVAFVHGGKHGDSRPGVGCGGHRVDPDFAGRAWRVGQDAAE
jgi:hypothetical protein